MSMSERARTAISAGGGDAAAGAPASETGIASQSSAGGALGQLSQKTLLRMVADAGRPDRVQPRGRRRLRLPDDPVGAWVARRAPRRRYGPGHVRFRQAPMSRAIGARFDPPQSFTPIQFISGR
jgi:hypothetical protein